ncbi:unnamed protein product [Orchesella dallaii]|uniref:RING-type E3 ubiquitin transferase n=1 Tax=Orchesella dallaii TaxID=48710 RepID=A0ABP1QG62_9HEXA
MGAKASTEQRPRTYSGSEPGGGGSSTATAVQQNNNGTTNPSERGGGMHHHHHHHHHHHSFRGGNGGGNGQFPAASSSHPTALLQGPSSSSVRARSYSSSAVHSTQASAGIIELGSRINSFASGLWPISGVKCPICNRSILPDDIEVHLVMCLTRPRLNYNEDFLEESKGDECVICLEELEAGQVIARLPCLCVYHKACIDEWFQINRSCPEHPNN